MQGFIFSAALVGLLLSGDFAGAQTKKAPSSPKSTVTRTRKISPVKARILKKTARKKPRYKPAPPVDPTIGDNVDGEDLDVRRAAVAALGTIKGTVVAVDPTNGRILTIVNQNLALQGGFTPCSTIKLVTSLAALSERVVERNDVLRFGRNVSFNLTSALARSNNPYFSTLGIRLGFERVTRYAQMLGLGERAGLNIEGEQPGTIPAQPPKWGGVGMMTSFGEGFLVTPLELAALVSAISNGGTLYYLQYPRTSSEIAEFSPKVKRVLELSPTGIEDIKAGMRGAVDYGTARRANYDSSEQILGKTGTCTDFRVSSHMGWFASYIEGPRPVVVVVMLTGTKTVNGPVDSGIAGGVYRRLSEQSWFASASPLLKEKDGMPELITAFPRQ